MHKKTFTLLTPESRQIVLNKSGEYLIKLSKSGAHADIVTAVHLTDSQKLDITITVEHLVPNTTANTVCKVIADDASQVRLVGTIIVAPGAQQTNSYLQQRILLLSSKAKAEAIPNLEIEANEVKCSHAATVGKIPEEYLFYLQTRGIPRSQAKKMLADGFLAEVRKLLKE